MDSVPCNAILTTAICYKLQKTCYTLKGNVMEYFKPGEQMRMMYYSVMTQTNSEKEIPSAPVSGQTSYEPSLNGLSSHESPVAQW